MGNSIFIEIKLHFLNALKMKIYQVKYPSLA